MKKEFYIKIFFKTKGSDRHDIAIYSDNPPTVLDLLNECEKKTRVPKAFIQIIFKGQKLHTDSAALLCTFGIFNGSRILMVGEKVKSISKIHFLDDFNSFIYSKVRCYSRCNL